MPAESKSQQRLFGMVHAVQKGEMKAPSKKVSDIAKSIEPSSATEFAETSHKGLPEEKASATTGLPEKKSGALHDRLKRLFEPGGGLNPGEVRDQAINNIGGTAGGVGGAGLGWLIGDRTARSANIAGADAIAKKMLGFGASPRHWGRAVMRDRVTSMADDISKGFSSLNPFARGAGNLSMALQNAQLPYNKGSIIKRLLSGASHPRVAMGGLMGLALAGGVGGAYAGEAGQRKLMESLAKRSGVDKTSSQSKREPMTTLTKIASTMVKLADHVEQRAAANPKLKPLHKLGEALRSTNNVRQAVRTAFPKLSEALQIKLAANVVSAFMKQSTYPGCGMGKKKKSLKLKKK